MTDLERTSLPWRACRLLPGGHARARGYLRMLVKAREAEARAFFVPVWGEAPIIARPMDPDAAITIDEGDATLEPLTWPASVLGWLRRRFTGLGRTVLDFGSVEVFAEGSKSQTRDYRKLVKSAGSARMPFDGPFLQAHPELILGWSPEAAVPAESAGPNPLSVAIAIHLHYIELWPEIETLLGRWRTPFKLFLTLTGSNDDLARRVRTKYPDCEVRVVENSGRDVRPFLLLLEEGAFDRFDLVCKIHGKRSLRERYAPLLGELVRRATFLDLIGSQQQVTNILTLFEGEPRLGIVGPERFRASSRHGRPSELMGANREAIETMALEMGAAVQGHEYDVFWGTMFWVRPQALAPLRRLQLANAFPPEAGLSHGALEHTVEALINHSVRLAGFEVVGVSAA